MDEGDRQRALGAVIVNPLNHERHHLGLLPGGECFPDSWAVALRRLAEALAYVVQDPLLQLPRRNRLGRAALPAPLLGGTTDVIAIAPGPFGRMTGRHVTAARPAAPGRAERCSAPVRLPLG